MTSVGESGEYASRTVFSSSINLSLFIWQIRKVKKKTHYLYLAALGIPAMHRLSLVVASGGYPLLLVHRLLIAVASLVVGCGLSAHRVW